MIYASTDRVCPDVIETLFQLLLAVLLSWAAFGRCPLAKCKVHLRSLGSPLLIM